MKKSKLRKFSLYAIVELINRESGKMEYANVSLHEYESSKINPAEVKVER